MSQYEYINCKPYKGYDISKSYELDSKGRRIPHSARYTVSDSDEDWIGDTYKTLAEAHRFIDEYEADMTGVVGSTEGANMKITAASKDKLHSKDYIKTALFDWLTDYYTLDIDGVPADVVVSSVEALPPEYNINDVFNLAMDEGIGFVEALEMIEKEVGIR